MAGTINLNLLSAFNDKGVKDALSSLKGLSDKMGAFSKKLLGGIGAWELWNKGTDFIRSSIDASRDLERNMSGLKTIFGEASTEMAAFAATGVSFGQSTAEAAKASTFLGSVLKQSGFSIEENTMLTKQLVVLGADLAATYGYDVQEALTGMTAMFRGEYDPIEKFGVAIKQAQVNSEMASLGLNKLTGTEKLHAQQLIRMKLLFQATADAQGAFARNGDTLFVSQQKLAATWTNLKATIATSLTGPLANVVQIMQNVVGSIGPSLERFFGNIAVLLQAVAGSAGGGATQISNLIDQLSLLASMATPILGTLVTLMGSFGAQIVSTVIIMRTVYTTVLNVGKAVETFRGIMAALAVQQTITTATATALTAAEGAAGAAALTTSATLAATPWGAIAIGAAAVAAALWQIGSAMPNQSVADQGVVDPAAYVDRLKMVEYEKSKVEALKSVYNSFGSATYFADQRANSMSSIRAAIRADDKNFKGKPKADPMAELNAMIKEMQKQIGKGIGAIGSGISSKKDKIANEFKDMVKKIKDELASLHESLMGAFDITSMGKSGASISRNMSKLMEKMRTFSALIKDLRQKGLNADLLTQIVKAGPVAGLDAAKALASNDALLKQANTSYAEYGALATGIASEAIQAKYQNQYNITVGGGVGSGATIGKAVVAAIQAFERQSGSSWRA